MKQKEKPVYKKHFGFCLVETKETLLALGENAVVNATLKQRICTKSSIISIRLER